MQVIRDVVGAGRREKPRRGPLRRPDELQGAVNEGPLDVARDQAEGEQAKQARPFPFKPFEPMEGLSKGDDPPGAAVVLDTLDKQLDSIHHAIADLAEALRPILHRPILHADLADNSISRTPDDQLSPLLARLDQAVRIAQAARLEITSLTRNLAL